MPQPPILFNRCGSTTEATHSVIGENGVEGASVDYTTGYFGNGINSNNTNKYVEFANAGDIYLGAAGTFEFWMSPYADITNGTIPAGTRSVFSMANTNNNLFDLLMSPAGIAWRIRVGGTYYGFGNTSYTPADFDLATGAWGHVAFVWNSAGIDGGSDTCRFYFNGAKLLNTTSALTLPSSIGVLWLGSYIQASTLHANAVLDNFKIYSYAKLDFNDRFNERGGLDDQLIT